MDPLLALSLAGNVIQFLEFANKLFKESREVYHSASGSSGSVLSLATISAELSTLNKSFSAEDLQSLGMQNVAGECDVIAQELQSLVDQLTLKKPKHNYWASFALALQTVLRKGEIQDLQRRLDRIQLRFGVQMQKLVLQQQSKLLQAFQNFEEANRRVDLDRNSVSAEFKTLLLDTLRDLDKKKTKQDVWARRLSLLPPAMARISVMSRQISEEQSFLKSLRFDEIGRRWINVVPAHHRTFEWVFEDTASREHGNTSIGLKDWLLHRGGHFWLEGKAGSGKSTLMKFICGHSKTQEYLSTWASNARKGLVTAKFFFWHSGSPLEKSQEGLLRSLLYGILSKCPDLIRKVRPENLPSPDSQARNYDWTREELFSMFHKFKTRHLPLRFCFFIDGLDEYGGHHDELIETLQELMSLPDVKICLSSRPWRPFRDAFGKSKEWTVKLQDLTRSDIRSYVTDTFMKDRSFQAMAARDPQYGDLVEEVVNRAEGVFLWVFLVVRSLLDGIRERDLISGLRYRLDRLPQNLEAFFRHMISQIDGIYLRSRTLKAFQLALASPEPPLLSLYSIVDEMEGREASQPSQVTLQHYTGMKETMEIRLDARCKGLLEISTKNPDMSMEHSFFNYSVVFLHRTVRDFLSENLHDIFGDQLDESYNASFALCQALGTVFRLAAKEHLTDIEKSICGELVGQLFYHAREVAIHEPTSRLTVECSGILADAELALQKSTWWKWKRKKSAFIGDAVEWNLCHFVKAQITARPDLMKARERPLLDRALIPSKSKYVGEALRSVEMVTILLEARADPNAKFADETAWSRFLGLLQDHPELADKAGNVDITRGLLQAGADPFVLVNIKETYTMPVMRRQLTGLPAWEATRIADEIRAKKVLEKVFGPERYAFIMNARPPAKTTMWQTIRAAVWSRWVYLQSL